MSKLALRLGIVLACIGLAAGTTHAYGGHGRNPQMMRKYMTFRLNDMLDQVQATPDQRQRVLALANPLFDRAQQLMAQHQQAHAQMLQEWQKDSPDPNVLRTLVNQQSDAWRQFGLDMTNAFLQVHQILTPQQRAQLVQEFQQEMQQHQGQ